ncbi:MAG: GerAB/ArcD/ProY family transporter, partial [Clostridia bacterium]|nr:GerAB/ArcD/ProY family transporter [Clostridia bacterium]
LNKGKTFDEILSDTLTPVGAKIVFLFYAFFFILRIMGGLLDTQELISSTLSVVTNWVAFVVPVLLVIGFNVVRGARNIGRVSQIFFGFIFSSVVMILLLSLKNTDFSNLQPTFANGFGIVAKSAFDISFWFSDCLFILFMLGKITKTGHFSIKVSLAFLVGACTTILLDIIFLCLFGNLAEFSSSALAKVSGFNLTGSVYGRIDWIFVMIWASSIIIKCTLFLWCATMSLSHVFGVNNKKGYFVLFGAIGVVFVVLPLVLPIKNIIVDFFCLGACKYITIFVQYVIPLAMPLLTFLSNKKTKLNKRGSVYE